MFRSSPPKLHRATRWLATVLLAGTVAAVAGTGTAHASVADCQMAISFPVAPWGTGFQATVKVTNIGTTPTTTWVVLIGYPWSTTPVTAWNTTMGTPWSMTTGVLYNFSNVSFNGSLAPGASTTFGFSATGVPTSNGYTCSVS